MSSDLLIREEKRRIREPPGILARRLSGRITRRKRVRANETRDRASPRRRDSRLDFCGNRESEEPSVEPDAVCSARRSRSAPRVVASEHPGPAERRRSSEGRKRQSSQRPCGLLRIPSCLPESIRPRRLVRDRVVSRCQCVPRVFTFDHVAFAYRPADDAGLSSSAPRTGTDRASRQRYRCTGGRSDLPAGFIAGSGSRDSVVMLLMIRAASAVSA